MKPAAPAHPAPRRPGRRSAGAEPGVGTGGCRSGGVVVQAAAQRPGLLRSGVVEASIEVVAEAPARPSCKAGKA